MTSKPTETELLPERVNEPEPQPIPNGGPPVWEMVIADMRERDNTGFQKYGTRLQPNNGRNALVDAYQEALDLVVYLRQVIAEQSNTRTPSPTPSSAEARARARELVDEWRNTWRGMSDACMTANRIDLIDRIARLSTPQPTLQQVDNRAAIDLLEKWLSETPSEDEESWEKIRRLIDENRLSDRKFWPELSTTPPTLQQAIEKVKELRDKWEGQRNKQEPLSKLRNRYDAAWCAANEIITALSSLASTQPDGWLPIESAPKDGDDVLLWCPEENDFVEAYWRDDAKDWDTADGWLTATPTLWMRIPRPEPPKEQK